MSTAGVSSDERRALLESISRALQAGDIAEGRRLSEQALGQGLEHPLFLNLRALGHDEAGRHEDALQDLRRAHFLAPDDFAILNALGLACARTDRFAEAVACYDKALAIRPDFAPAWYNRGWSLERQGEMADAARSYDKATELDPKHAHAWANTAWLAAGRGDAVTARAAAERSLGLQPDIALADLALAAVELDDPASAEQRLRGLLARPDLDASHRALALSQLGDALDRQDRPGPAFEAYDEGNRVFRAIAAPRYEAPGQETAADALGWMLQWAEDLDGAVWRSNVAEAPSQAGEREHVFLMGFPRSGTTLIESMLGVHPDIVTLEERNTLQASMRAFLADPQGLRRLQLMSPRALQSYRDDYWRSVQGFGADPRGKIFIDKNPFNTLRLPLIWKLFPRAKVIFAVRDPRDVVFSCFRRRFGLNPSNYQFLDLERTARFYDGSMRFAAALREKQDLAEHRMVYERLIDDFGGESRAVCAFIGAAWRGDLDDFADRGRRGGVASASAAQISRGLFSDGAGQWRRYRDQLAPILPVLAPWVERFGYPPV
jgi:tetratricopeptide (TPR) repeat protein